jgi:DNA-binding transcriptional MocR family regulator
VLRTEIRRLAAGARLPSTRELTNRYRVSPVTVARAIATLVSEGLVVSRPGTGTFVADRPAARSAGQAPGRASDLSWQSVALGERVFDTEGLSPLADPPGDDGVISLASGYPHPALMPAKALATALSHAAHLPGAWDRPPAAGLAGLRGWFAAAAAAGIEPRDVLITPGGQAALSAAFRALGRPGDALLAESPTYPGALAAARLAGLRVLPVPVDEQGVVPALLADAFARSSARAFYCQPSFHNPAGTVLAASRRAEVLSVARAAGAFVVEDDACRVLSHGAPPPPPLLAGDDDGRVVYLTSLTKAASPSLRIGALIARGPVAARLSATRAIDDLFVARPLQEAALDLVTRPLWRRHLRDLGAHLRQRAHTLSSALRAGLPDLEFTTPSGGMHLWVRLPAGADDVELAASARRIGVAVMPGRPFFPAEAPAPFLRMTFSAAASDADLREGVSRLAAAAG